MAPLFELVDTLKGWRKVRYLAGGSHFPKSLILLEGGSAIYIVGSFAKSADNMKNDEQKDAETNKEALNDVLELLIGGAAKSATSGFRLSGFKCESKIVSFIICGTILFFLLLILFTIFF